jgi:hypothetical protein
MSTKQVIEQLHTAITALEDEDVRVLPEAILTEQIDDLVAILHQLDRHLTRVANAVLSRSFVVSEVMAA